MNDPLRRSLAADLALAGLEERLIERARGLQRLGFSSGTIAPSQMNAVGEILRTAASHEQALAELGRWMANQLEKLRKEEERKRSRSSWRLQPRPGGSADCLGEELLAWVSREIYLNDLDEEALQGLDRLSALQRFWARFHGFYRYEDETGEPMPLAALDLGRREDGPS